MDLEKLTEETKKIVSDELKKTLQTSSNFTTYVSLETPAKTLLSFETPVLDSIPRVPVKGKSVSWDVLTSITSRISDGSASEGAKGSAVTFKYEPASATIKKQSLSGSITDFNMDLGRNFNDDIKAKNYVFTLSKLKELIEMMVIGGTIEKLDTPSQPIATPSTEDGIVPIVSGYSVKVAALTSTGIYDLIQNEEDEDLILNSHGYTVLSANNTFSTTTNTSSVLLQTDSVKNAFGYAWFVGAAGSEKLQAITSGTVYNMTRLSTTGQLASTITVDKSGNPLAFDGLTTQGITSGCYYKDMLNKSLTKSTSGGIVEVDDMFAYMHKKYKLSPDVIYVGRQFHIDMTVACMNPENGIQRMVTVDSSGQIDSNNLLTIYRNNSRGLKPIKVVQHPYLPSNMMIALTTSLPYPNTNLSNVIDMGVFSEYNVKNYAETDDVFEYAVRCWQAPRHYIPKSMGIIVNSSPLA